MERYIVYNRETCYVNKPVDDVPSIRVAKNLNRITFNKLAINLMGLTDKSRIAFVQDREIPSDFYIVRDEKGFVLHFHNNSLLTESKPLASMFRRIMGKDCGTIKIETTKRQIGWKLKFN